MNHIKNWGGGQKVPRGDISNYYALICIVGKSLLSQLNSGLYFPIDFIHRIQNFENMKKVYNKQDI